VPDNDLNENSRSRSCDYWLTVSRVGIQPSWASKVEASNYGCRLSGNDGERGESARWPFDAENNFSKVAFDRPPPFNSFPVESASSTCVPLSASRAFRYSSLSTNGEYRSSLIMASERKHNTDWGFRRGSFRPGRRALIRKSKTIRACGIICPASASWIRERGLIYVVCRVVGISEDAALGNGSWLLALIPSRMNPPLHFAKTAAKTERRDSHVPTKQQD